MILVDTSVWIAHFRSGHPTLPHALEQNLVVTHPFVIGELALGTLRQRAETIRLLRLLPLLQPIRSQELLQFIEFNELPGAGIGLVDAHLLGAAVVHGCRLLTVDKRLAGRADSMGVAA